MFGNDVGVVTGLRLASDSRILKPETGRHVRRGAGHKRHAVEGLAAASAAPCLSEHLRATLTFLLLEPLIFTTAVLREFAFGS